MKLNFSCLMQINNNRGSGCGLVGRVVASDIRCLGFVSSHQQIFLDVNCIKKTKIEKKEAGNGPFKKQLQPFF